MDKLELLNFLKENPDRVYYFNENINDVSGRKYLDFLLSKYKENSIKEIVTFVSNFGGSVEESISLFDVIKLIDIKTITIGTGIVASAANILLASGKIRFATPHTKFLIHQLYRKLNDSFKVDDLIAETYGSNLTRELFYKIHKESFPKIPKKVLEGSTAISFGCEQAIRYGIIHGVL